MEFPDITGGEDNTSGGQINIKILIGYHSWNIVEVISEGHSQKKHIRGCSLPDNSTEKQKQ